MRWIGLLGLGLAVTGGIGFAVAPWDTAAGDSARAVADHYSEHRTEIIVYSWMGAVGNALQLVFFAGLSHLVADSPLGRTLARLGLVAIAVEVTGVSIAFSILAAVAYREPAPETAQALVDVAWIVINQAAGPVTSIGLLAFALALRRAGVAGGWLVPYTAFVAAAHLVVAGAFAREGFLSPEGGIAIVVPMLFFSWFAAVGALLVRGERDGP